MLYHICLLDDNCEKLIVLFALLWRTNIGSVRAYYQICIINSSYWLFDGKLIICCPLLTNKLALNHYHLIKIEFSSWIVSQAANASAFQWKWCPITHNKSGQIFDTIWKCLSNELNYWTFLLGLLKIYQKWTQKSKKSCFDIKYLNQ